MTLAAGVAWMFMLLDAGGVLAGPATGQPPLSSMPNSPDAKMQLKVVPAVACRPVVLGWKCPLELSVTNLSKDVVVAYYLTTNRPADGEVSIVARQLGNSFEPYQAKAGDSILLLSYGTVTADAMFKAAEKANVIIA